MTNELGASLRLWRDRIGPAAVGLAPGPTSKRRSSGLRREELASLAGVSVDYVTRLEQGRATSPSPQVLTALARALQLSTDERDYLFRVAGQPPQESRQVSGHITAGLQRLLQRLDDVPVGVYDAAWNLVAWNPAWATLMGDPSPSSGRDRNLLWRRFNGSAGRVVHEGADADDFDASSVADLRATAARYADDADLHRLISDLTRASRRFAELWESRAVGRHSWDKKHIEHPEVGRLSLDCDVMTVQGSDLKVVAYTAEPGSPDADKLALLRVVGLQTI